MAPALEITPIGNHRSAKAHPKKFERAFEPAVFCSPGQTGLVASNANYRGIANFTEFLERELLTVAP